MTLQELMQEAQRFELAGAVSFSNPAAPMG
jgi:hypothetical protein